MTRRTRKIWEIHYPNHQNKDEIMIYETEDQSLVKVIERFVNVSAEISLMYRHKSDILNMVTGNSGKRILHHCGQLQKLKVIENRYEDKVRYGLIVRKFSPDINGKIFYYKKALNLKYSDLMEMMETVGKSKASSSWLRNTPYGVGKSKFTYLIRLNKALEKLTNISDPLRLDGALERVNQELKQSRMIEIQI